MHKSPFKFLDSYSREDRDIFFGRDREIEELHSRVFQGKILVVYGISGTGKTSLINCGLANKFSDSDWLPVNIRRGSNINESLADTLLKYTEAGSYARTGSEVSRLLRSVYLDHFKPVFLIFDQFEEVFIFGNKSERDEFILTVKKITESDLQCRFIFSVREEYLAGFTEFERIIPSFLSNRIRIEKMTSQNAISVIEGPCSINGIQVDQGFSETLLERLNPDSPEVELTYLQVYLDKIFRVAAENGGEVRNMSKEHISRVGDVKDLLGSFLEEQISKLENRESALVILKSFVSVRGTKHQITEQEVIEYSRTLGQDIKSADVREFIQKFINLRILRDKDENGRYELRHDSLASTIFAKITLVEKELLEVRQFIENSWGNFEKRNLYLTAEDLQYIAPYEDKLFLNENISGFITQSKKEIHRAKRRRQNILAAAAVIIIAVLSFFTLWAFRERSNALDQKAFAETQKDAAVKAKTAADSARHDALTSRNLAVENERLAETARKQSDEARKEAVAEREYALQQKSLAEKLTLTANEQARIANEEKMRAEQQRIKAVAAEGKAKQLGLLSTAQNLALKAINMEKDPQLMGMLAVQAYTFNKDNGGQPDDPVIYEALHEAWTSADSSKHSIFNGSGNEIWGIAENDKQLITADLDGNIVSWNPDGSVSHRCSLAFLSPISFISLDSSGDYIVTQHDNRDLLLWKYEKGREKLTDYQKLSGHTGFIRSAAFTGKYLATGGRDSQVIVRDIVSKQIVKTIRAESPVISLVFCSPDTLVYAEDNGSVYLQDLKSDKSLKIYSSKNEKILSLAWNKRKKLLFAGSSGGSLMSFSIKGSSFTPPSGYLIHTAGIDLIAFNKDFTLLATAGRDKTMRLFFYDEFFEKGNSIGGVARLDNLNNRIRSLCFTGDNKLAAGLSDKTIYIRETSSEKLAGEICRLIHRDFTPSEWNDMVGADIPYEPCCNKQAQK